MRFAGLLVSAVLLSACSSDFESENLDVGKESDALYYLSSRIWPTNLVDVCWESATAANATERGWVREQVTKTWEGQTGIQFTGWGACPAKSSGIRIRVADEWPRTLALGSDLRGMSGGMILNFTFTFTKDGKQPFAGCIGTGREACIRKIGAHEFGHALGYAHEQNRLDTPTTCTQGAQGTNGDTTVGSWDINSIMNYCNPHWNNDGVLSATDLLGTQQLYGLHPYRPSFVLANYGANAGTWRTDRHVRLLGDVDGDGRSDIVGYGDAGVYVSRATGAGFAQPTFALANFGYNQGWRVEQHVRLLGDVNGDGKKDLVAFGNDGVWVSYATAGGFTPAAFVVADFGYNQGWRVEQHLRMLGDVNGDGKKDIVAFGNDGIWVAYATGNGFSAPVFAVANLGYNQAWRVDQNPRYVVDVNGDGREDVVGFGNDGVWVSLANATGLSPAAFWLAGFAPNAGAWSSDRHPRMMADVNGDKKNDIVGFGDDGVWVSLATGTGFAPAGFWLQNFGYNAGSWRVDKHVRLAADVNGDGRADIVGFGDNGLYVATSSGVGLGAAEFRIRNFGYDAGGWRIASNPILVDDVSKDGHADVVGFGNDGVWLTLQ